MKKYRSLVIGLCLLWCSGVIQGESHPFSVMDMLAMDRISDIRLSPDYRSIAFVLRKTDLEANRGITDLWIADSKGNELRSLTDDPEADFNPRWDPDGRHLWFLSSRGGSVQVWKINVENGHREQVTRLPLDCGNLVVSPVGGYIAFTLDVFPGHSVEETVARLEKMKQRRSSGIVYDRLFIRHWDTWEDKKRSHLFVLDPEDRRLCDVMKEMDVDTPVPPFGGPEEISFTPDGQGILFTASSAGDCIAWSTNYDLYHVPLDLSAPPRAITGENKAWDTLPVFSPDGRRLAYLAMQRPGFEADRFRIVLQDWPGGSPRVITEKWDRSPSSIVWSPDSRVIYAVAGDLGQRSIFRIDPLTGRVQRLWSRGTVSSLNVSPDRLIFGLDHLKSPVEIHSFKPGEARLSRITAINREKVGAARMGEPEQFVFKGWNGEPVHCYVVKPVDLDPAQKYPVAFLIHGGPQGSFGNHFHYRWNPQAYAGAGFAAVMVDFHGSTGYGQAFTDSISRDWGGKPLVDLRIGLREALARYPWMDGERVAALGASFGGYMINWIAGNWPDRFRCLVNHDGNLDERMAYYDTEELWFPEWEHGGTPWENPEGYEKHNPVNYIQNWKTPMLVIHGAHDFRVVETQGFSTFTALQRRGIPSRLLYFPDENHWILKPHNSIQWHETVLEWIRKWVAE